MIVAEPAPVTVIVGGDVNQPDGGAAGEKAITGAGGGGGVGENPGPLFDAHATLPAPSTTWTTTRICSLAMPAGTDERPSERPAEGHQVEALPIAARLVHRHDAVDAGRIVGG